MYLDKLNTPIFSSSDLFELIYLGYDITQYEAYVEQNNELDTFVSENDNKLRSYKSSEMPITDFDIQNQHNWFTPPEYKDFDILAFCIAKCKNNEERNRVHDEYAEYEMRHMIDVLRWIKYFVDTCNANNVIYGVGRGSSVASYILYLIGVHRINSIKYGLDWHEFLR